jgi:CDP-glycerol glycerophosphotransferase (TagB/SpsB family)
MDISTFKDKKVLIAPYTPLSKSFASELQKYSLHVVGFIDLYKDSENVYKPHELSSITYDCLLIYNKTSFTPIYNSLKKVIPSSKIYRAIKSENGYTILNKNEILKDKFKKSFRSLKQKFYQQIQNIVSRTYDTFNLPRKLTLFITKNSCGSNLKHLYMYYLEQNRDDMYLVLGNENELHEISSTPYPFVEFGSLKSHILAGCAKTLICEQVIHKYFQALSPNQTSLQLWHGIALKKLYNVKNISYDYLLSTSPFVSKESLADVFDVKEYLEYGYPRNDILLKDINSSDLLFCDTNIFEMVQDNQKRNIQNIIYMPTYRESDEHNIPPLNFEAINTFMQQNNLCFILKLHPFVIEQFEQKLDTNKSYSNIIFYNTQGDIYPVLKYADILITDYSSIAFDFLLLQRPIIYFDYDLEEYIESRGEFLLDYESFTPGIKVKNEQTLLQAISSLLYGNDEFIQKREAILDKLFTYQDAHSRERIDKKLHHLDDLDT